MNSEVLKRKRLSDQIREDAKKYQYTEAQPKTWKNDLG